MSIVPNSNDGSLKPLHIPKCASILTSLEFPRLNAQHVKVNMVAIWSFRISLRTF